MNIWVLSGTYEGEQFASSHLTEKGATLSAISDVLQLLGIEDEETAKEVCGTNDTEADVNVDHPEWDLANMQKLTRDKLWDIFNEWSEYVWDNHMNYNVEVIKTTLQA
jgi:hypothetical protein